MQVPVETLETAPFSAGDKKKRYSYSRGVKKPAVEFHLEFQIACKDVWLSLFTIVGRGVEPRRVEHPRWLCKDMSALSGSNYISPHF